jgi:cell division protein FtsB
MKILKKIFFIFLTIFLFFSLIPNILNFKNRLGLYQEIKKELEEEKKKTIELKTNIAKKKSVSEIEKTIRNKLNLLKENEVMIIIPSPTIIPQPSPTVTLTNWQKWWKVFF